MEISQEKLHGSYYQIGLQQSTNEQNSKQDIQNIQENKSFQNVQEIQQQNVKLMHSLQILEQEKINIQSERNEYKKKYELMKQEKDNLEKKQKNIPIISQPQHSTPQGMDDYDALIQFTDIKYLLKYGADTFLKYNEDSPQYKNILSKNVHIVSILGKFQTGKTFIHKKLSEQYIKQGKLHATQGLNINFCDKFWLIDTPGLGKALQNFSKVSKLQKDIQNICKETDNLSQQLDQEVYQEKVNQQIEKKKQIDNLRNKQINNFDEIYKDNVALETFIQSFIMKYSDIIIYVCETINLEEQIHIAQITQKIDDNNQNQQLIVCHNMKTVQNISDFQELIEKNIYNNFNIQHHDKIDCSKSIYKEVRYDVQNKNKQYVTKHIVFGKDGSDIADKYNDKSIEQIYQTLEYFDKPGQTRDIFESFKNYTNENIQKYIMWNKLKFKNKSENENLNDLYGNVPSKPNLELCYDKNKIYSPQYKMLDENTIFCKNIQSNFLEFGVNEIQPEVRNLQYKVFKKDIAKDKILKTILISVPGMNMVERVKKKIHVDNKKIFKNITIQIIYKQGENAKLLQEIQVNQNDEDQDHYNNQKLQFQDLKFDIPICLAEDSYNNLQVTALEKYSLYKINVEIIKEDQYFSDLD